jgi:hypothetical protein
MAEELDLDGPDASSPSWLQTLKPEPYNEAKDQNQARRTIAYWLLGIMSLVVVLAFILLFTILAASTTSTSNRVEHLITLMNVLFGPIITLVGSATGFYFGAQSAKPTGS